MLKAFLQKLGWVSERAPETAAIMQVPAAPPALRDNFRQERRVSPEPIADGPVEKDAWEGWYINQYGAEGDRMLVFDAEIVYTDGNNQKTKRRITTRRFGPNPYGKPDDLLILAFCHLRQENRTFAASRISQLVNVSTGEVAKDIPTYLIGLYEASPAGQTVRLLDQMADEVTALLFVARADGRISPKEKSALVEFLQRAAPQTDIDVDTITAAFSAVPSQAALKRALKAIIDKGQGGAVLCGINDLIAARTKMDDFTRAASNLVKNRLVEALRPAKKY